MKPSEAWADVLERERAARFVGRKAESATLREALAADSSVRMVYVLGPGGVGKTELLRAWAREAKAVSRVHWVDGDYVGAGRRDLSEALTPPASMDRPQVVVLDTFEAVADREDWLRSEFFPVAPADVRYLIAGRTRLSPLWRADAGWRRLLRQVELAALSADETAAFLDHAAVPQELHAKLFCLTRGHPLALGLAVALGSEALAVSLDKSPDGSLNLDRISGDLLGILLRDVTTPDQRRVVETAAFVPALHLGLLTHVLGDVDRARDALKWLAHRAFVNEVQAGLVLHDICRESLLSELQRGPAEHYFRTLEPVWAYCLDDPVRGRADIGYVARHIDGYAQAFQGVGELPLRVVPLEEHHLPTVRTWIRQHEGEVSLELFEYWWTRLSMGVAVEHCDSGELMGYSLQIQLDGLSLTDVAPDPFVRSLFETRVVPRAATGGVFLAERFWGTRGDYQSPGPAQGLLFQQMAVKGLSTPDVAAQCMAFLDPNRWEALAARVGIVALRDIPLPPDGSSTWFLRDMTAQSYRDWALSLFRAAASRAMTESGALPQISLLDQPAFEEAVRQAFGDLFSSEKLDRNPLLRSRLVQDARKPGAAAEGGGSVIASLLRAEVATLADADTTAARVLKTTYFGSERHRKQEAIAAHLGLSYSTYRRRLLQARQRIAHALWRRETSLRGVPDTA